MSAPSAACLPDLSARKLPDLSSAEQPLPDLSARKLLDPAPLGDRRRRGRSNVCQINHNELEAFMSIIDAELTQRSFQEALEKLDVNQDDLISCQEFILSLFGEAKFLVEEAQKESEVEVVPPGWAVHHFPKGRGRSGVDKQSRND